MQDKFSLPLLLEWATSEGYDVSLTFTNPGRRVYDNQRDYGCYVQVTRNKRFVYSGNSNSIDNDMCVALAVLDSRTAIKEDIEKRKVFPGLDA